MDHVVFIHPLELCLPFGCCESCCCERRVQAFVWTCVPDVAESDWGHVRNGLGREASHSIPLPSHMLIFWSRYCPDTSSQDHLDLGQALETSLSHMLNTHTHRKHCISGLLGSQDEVMAQKILRKLSAAPYLRRGEWPQLIGKWISGGQRSWLTACS